MGNGGSGDWAGRPHLNPCSNAEPFPEIVPPTGKQTLKQLILCVTSLTHTTMGTGTSTCALADVFRLRDKPQPTRVSSLPGLCGFQASISSHQAWWQDPFLPGPRSRAVKIEKDPSGAWFDGGRETTNEKQTREFCETLCPVQIFLPLSSPCLLVSFGSIELK